MEITAHNQSEAIAKLVNCPDFPKGEITITIKQGARTNTQNNSLHLFCGHQAILLNDQGLDQVKVIEQMRDGVELEWSKHTVKDNLWRPLQKAMFGKDSTTKINTVEPSLIYRNLKRWFDSKEMPCAPWPDRFNR